MILFIVGLFFSVMSLIFLIKNKYLLVYFSLFLTILCIRLFYNAQDPYLHDWDEKYHAIVAKNMLDAPLKPMLREDPVLPYNYRDWSDNHIWLHKQPLFLWQMALSMKIFGVNEFAVRFPSAVLCALLGMILFRIGILCKKPLAGVSAALLFGFSYFSIEQTNGAIGMDHNDVAMTIYITASLWTLMEYYQSGKLKWILLTGLFSGMAILVKWMVGLLVYACWGIYILLFKLKGQGIKNILPPFLALLVTVVIFLPWQIYILKTFPTEAKYEFAFAQRHLTEVVEKHSGTNLYYINLLKVHYHGVLIPFIISGIILAFFSKLGKTNITVMISSVFIIYLFFSFIPETKTVGYVFIVSPIVFFLIALNVEFLFFQLKKKLNSTFSYSLTALFLVVLCVVNLRYQTLTLFHTTGKSNYNWESRAGKIHNTAIYKSLKESLHGDYVVINCKPKEETEAMFYSDQNVYSSYPSKEQIDSLQNAGYKIAAFASYGQQILPEYIMNDEDIVIIDVVLR